VSRALWWLWRRLVFRVPGSDRMVVAAGVTIRTGGLVALGYTMPVVWARLPYPGWSALLAAGLAGETAAVFGRWLRRGRADPATLALDVPTGVLALIVGSVLSRATYGGLVDFVYPYTVFASTALGLSTRRLWPVLVAGLTWAVTFAACRVVVDHGALGDTISLTPGYVAQPVVGWLSARALRRRAAAIDESRQQVVAQAAELAGMAERTRHGRALHDRVLQTLEALARGDTLREPTVRARVAEQAAWLRWFVETGRVEQDDDLAAGLAAAARAAGRAGVRVQLNDAWLRAADGDGLGPERREILVRVVHQAISVVAGPGGVVVRAVPDGAGVLVTLLGSGEAPEPDEVEDLVGQLATVRGTVTVEPGPYLTLRVPARSGATLPPRTDRGTP
jgi:hypothetical protein